jgi:diacylglycerol kinase family enzyme
VTIGTPDTTLKAIDAITDLMGAALAKTPTNREDIICLRTPQMQITTDPLQKVVIDGEIVGTTPIQVKCVPNSLSVIVPLISQQLSMHP